MGVRMMVEILDHAPPELSPAERLVLIAIAEDARDGGSRTCSPGVDMLCRRTGLSEEGLRKVFQRLAKHGLEIRVAIGKGKSGRLVFAKPGVRTTYRVPVFVAEEGGEWQDEKPEDWDESTAIKAVQTSQDDGMAVQTSRTSGREAQNSGREYCPSPSSPSSPNTYEGASGGGLFEEPPAQPKPPPTPQPKKPTKKPSSAPDSFEITPKLRQWAKEKVPSVDIDAETEEFLDHFRSNGKKHTDWVAAWRNWMRRSVKYASQRQQNHRGPLRVVGGSRNEVPDNSYWDTVTDEDLKRNLL
jgi:hypothetical protein